MSTRAVDLVATLRQHGAVMACLLEAPTDVATLTEEVSVSRSTVDRALAAFEGWGLIAQDANEISLTVVGRLVTTVYDAFEADVTTIVTQEGRDVPLWSTAGERTDALELVTDRIDLLEYARTPREKRTLVVNLPYASSTVDWIVRELEGAALIQRTADGYTTTSIGERIAARYRTLLTTLTDLLDARDLLAHLPADCALPPRLCTDADIERADVTTPYLLLGGLRTRLEAADRIRAVLPALPNPQLLDVCHHQVVRHGATLELIIDAALAETLTQKLPGPLAEMAAAAAGTFTAAVTDAPPFGLVLVDREGLRPSSSEKRCSSGSQASPDDIEERSSSGSQKSPISGDSAERRLRKSKVFALPKTRCVFEDSACSQAQPDDTDAGPSASLLVYTDHQTMAGAFHAETETALSWAENYYEHVHERATETTSDWLDTAKPTEDIALSAVADPSRVEREAEGFVQLTAEYFATRTAAPPVTAWRTGLDLVDVHAGYAIDRRRGPDSDGERRTLTEDLIGRLSGGGDHALIGVPGSGKSTVCKSVACRWYEQGRGTVFYRESTTGATFESPAILSAQLRAADGHVLVVVEDAVRGEANAVFRVMEKFRADPSVTFLLDARTGEWADPSAFPSDARLDAYRTDVVETVRIPTFDESTAERLIHQFQETTGHEVSLPVAHLLRGIESSAAESHEHPGNSPDDLLLLLHRLTLHITPLADTTANTPTTLAEAVQRTHEELRDAGETALDVGLLVNLLNAAGLDVQPAFVFALADTETETAAVHAALSQLESHIIFERGERSDDPSYRTVHEAWSELFLHQLLTASETERHARQRFGRCVSALLSLAGEEARRSRGATAGRNAPPLGRIDRAPGEWADAIVERLFQFGLAHPGLAELFGTTEDATITLPAACSPELELRCARWRSRMYYVSGSLDRSKSESEHAISLVDADGDPSETALKIRARSYTDLGGVAWRRGELDTAADCLAAGLEGYRAIDDRFGIAKCYSNLGILAHDRGDLDAAIAHFERAHESYLEIGVSRELLSKSFNYLGRTVTNRGDLDRAKAYLRRSIDVVRDSHDYPELSFAFSNLGKIAQLRGDLDRAETDYKRGIDIARDAWYPVGNAWGLLGLGQVALDRGDLDTAAEYVRESLDIYREDEDMRGRARGLRCLGSIARNRGAFETAETHLQEAVACCRGDRFPLDEARTLVELGELAHARESHVRSREHFEAAIDMFREIGAARDATTAVERLDEL